MKKAIILFVFSTLLLVACSTTHPNTPAVDDPIPVVPLKIKQMKALTYSYETSNVGCSEIEFLKKFVGQKVRTSDGHIRVDNIMDIHKNVSSSQTSAFGIKSDEQFECAFWGMAVEYEK